MCEETLEEIICLKSWGVVYDDDVEELQVSQLIAQGVGRERKALRFYSSLTSKMLEWLHKFTWKSCDTVER